MRQYENNKLNWQNNKFYKIPNEITVDGVFKCYGDKSLIAEE